MDVYKDIPTILYLNKIEVVLYDVFDKIASYHSNRLKNFFLRFSHDSDSKILKNILLESKLIDEYLYQFYNYNSEHSTPAYVCYDYDYSLIVKIMHLYSLGITDQNFLVYLIQIL